MPQRLLLTSPPSTYIDPLLSFSLYTERGWWHFQQYFVTFIFLSIVNPISHSLISGIGNVGLFARGMGGWIRGSTLSACGT